jgi:hypothetical protein
MNKVIHKVTKSQGSHLVFGKNSKHNQKHQVSPEQREKIQGETQNCINFNVSPSFTHFISFLLMHLDRVTTLF